MITDMYKSAVGVALATGFLLLIPLLAMQFNNGVVWTLGDFIFAGTLLFATGFTFELARRTTSEPWYRAAAGVALASALFLVWSEGAGGLVGHPGGPAALMELGVLAIGVIGAIVARFQPRGMTWAMAVMALAQALVAAIALVAGFGSAVNTWYAILGPTGTFVALFSISAALFWNAAREQPTAGAAS